MSGIAAIIRFDGAPVEPGQIAAMTAAQAYRGPDGIHFWPEAHAASGSVALAHCMLHVTAESLDEAQPLASADGAQVLVMDGWIANRAELRADLLARGAMLRGAGDGELVLAAYQVWGEQCPTHIDGEFAFLIWDQRDRAAYLARDHAGLRSLHYHWDGQRLIVASDIAAVLAGLKMIDPHREPRANRGMLAEIIAGEWLSPDETVWQGVSRAGPARWMRFDRAGQRSGEYWSPLDAPPIRHDSVADYAAHYRTMLDHSVQACARSHAPLACGVSGGLDSSAVFAVAHHLHSKGALPAPGLKGYSYLAEAGSPADEIAYARAVGAHLGAELSEVPLFLPPMDWFRARVASDLDAAPYPNTAMAITLAQRAAADGCRVLLNGEGGDEFLWGRRFYYAEQLAGRDWRGLAASLRQDMAECGPAVALGWLWRYGAAPCLPRGLRRLGRTIIGQRAPHGSQWLSPAMQALLNQRRQTSSQSHYAAIANPAHRAMAMELDNPFARIMRDHLARQSAQAWLEPRYPMYSRRFIEFAFATPECTRLRGQTTKALHRHAMADLLPATVINRHDKGEYGAVFERLLDTPHLLEDELLPGESADLLSQQGIRQLYKRYNMAKSGEKPIWELWGTLLCGQLLLHSDDNVAGYPPR